MVLIAHVPGHCLVFTLDNGGLQWMSFYLETTMNSVFITISNFQIYVLRQK